MAKLDIPDFKAGDPISAAKLNKLLMWLRQYKITASPPLDVMETKAGINIRIARPKPIWAKITSGSNPYAWTMQVRSAINVFTDDPCGLSGTTTNDPAYEWNGLSSVSPGRIVLLETDPGTGQRIFQLDTC
jgi:hypothetical protein